MFIFFFLLRGCNFIIDLHYFKQLAVVANEISCSGYVYFGEHLKFVSGNLDSWFVDIFNIDVSDCIFDLFIIDVDQVTDQSLFKEFLILQHDNETKMSKTKLLSHVDTRVLLPGMVEGQISVPFLLRI